MDTILADFVSKQTLFLLWRRFFLCFPPNVLNLPPSLLLADGSHFSPPDKLIFRATFPLHSFFSSGTPEGNFPGAAILSIIGLSFSPPGSSLHSPGFVPALLIACRFEWALPGNRFFCFFPPQGIGRSSSRFDPGLTPHHHCTMCVFYCPLLSLFSPTPPLDVILVGASPPEMSFRCSFFL